MAPRPRKRPQVQIEQAIVPVQCAWHGLPKVLVTQRVAGCMGACYGCNRCALDVTTDGGLHLMCIGDSEVPTTEIKEFPAGCVRRPNPETRILADALVREVRFAVIRPVEVEERTVSFRDYMRQAEERRNNDEDGAGF